MLAGDWGKEEMALYSLYGVNFTDNYIPDQLGN